MTGEPAPRGGHRLARIRETADPGARAEAVSKRNVASRGVDDEFTRP
jgi:hypothetical protein